MMLAHPAASRFDAWSFSGDEDENNELGINELRWRARYDALLLQGYQLRPRYQPNWIPSWTITNKSREFCEDGVTNVLLEVLDAKKLDDNKTVWMKAVSNDSIELKIARMLSPTVKPNPNNHCVPILDMIPDPLNPQNIILVMPSLRPCNNPDFDTVEEIMDFIGQTIEGLSFLHSNGVAHRDCWTTNIMMDGQVLFPGGYHPILIDYTPDLSRDARALKRSGHPIKYYFIDFGLASSFSVGESPYVLGTKGANRDAPELSNSIPYNAFMLDVYTLGRVYQVEVLQKFSNVDFLRPLVTAMTDKQPERRPTAEAALKMFQSIRKYAEARGGRAVRWNETATEQVVNAISSAITTITSFKLT
ncbi:kinase-like domain-containing protein [Cristinia sonorae]|uniref:Kinase-like domain-containing protein n=1 Tax=Cristinia sonorae TaxID=1940300 RepID=A0A8K0XSB8_9AGAR|nr:kinase-like domain-containing protein [Cristinia sonorae]